MLVIRNDQYETLRQRSIERFECDMVATIEREWEPKFALLGEAEVRRLIRAGIDNGQKSGIRREGAVAVLIELMIQFGEHFQYSPERRWAEKILAHPVLPDYIKVDLARQRMTALTEGRTLMPVDAQRQTPEAGGADLDRDE